jgi:hypothetical protein
VRRTLLFATALLIATAGAGGNAWAATSPSPAAASTAKATARVIAGHESFSPGTKQVLRLAPKSAQPLAKAQPRVSQPLVILPVTAKINVTYIGFPAAARTAFQAAVNIWQTQIHSTVPIDVVADWSDLTTQFGPGVLGAAGPTDFVENFTNAPVANVFYPIALANAIAGSDQLSANVCNPDLNLPNPPNPSGAEISASFNSDQTLPWSFGPGPVANKVDFESVVLHELGHGLGFVGTNDVPGDPNIGVGTSGLSNDGRNLTIFDTFAADGSDLPLDATYASGTTDLGDALRGVDRGVTWDGPAGDAAAGGGPNRPVLYSPSSFQEGSSFSHLDEATYLKGNANALMTPGLELDEVERSPGPIMLGMFKDMGWPTIGSPSAIGDYHVAAPMRLATHATVTNGAPLTIQVTGVDAVPASAKAVAVNVAVQSPTKPGYWSTLPGCSGAGLPDTQNFLAGQTRSGLAVLPVGVSGQITISLTAVPAAAISGLVSVDLVGWYGSGGSSYHHLATPKQALSKSVGTTPVDVPILGVAGVPASGVTAVVLSAGVGFETTGAVLVVGPGGVTTIVPTVAYAAGELTSNLAIVPVGTGVGAGKIRVRTTAGASAAVLNVIGWYGPLTAGGQAFHPAGPVHLTGAPHGQDVTISGLPDSVQVMLDVHLANPSNNASLSAAPGGSPVLALVQEFKAKQPTSGATIVTTNAAGQVRLHLSGGVATFYVDFQGWFST